MHSSQLINSFVLIIASAYVYVCIFVWVSSLEGFTRQLRGCGERLIEGLN